MKPRRTPLSNQVFRLPGGTEDNDLWVERTRTEHGDACLRSVWELSADERRRIAAGENVYLIVWGMGTPPVALGVTDIPLGAHARPDTPDGEHRDRTSDAASALRDLIAMAEGDWSDPEKRPAAAPVGRCLWSSLDDLSDCDAPASSWRWGDDQGGWTPVCHDHCAESEETE